MLKPTERQLDYQEWKFGLFLHFGLRTFYEGYADFDGNPMSPADFNPARLNCEQWIRTAAEAGMRYAVLTAKHHDGFSNWPSRYTGFSVAASPWKEGKGDVVREFVDACDKYGMKKGLYYSPYDGSIDFYSLDPKAYDEYFLNQMKELLGEYGEIDILWFDTCGSEDHEYDWDGIIREIRNMQPGILIFNIGDPDFRWAGNEDGIAPMPCRNVVDALDFSILTEDKNRLDAQRWLPAECDVQLRDTWFFSDGNEHALKSVDELMGLYYHSVGKGANLLLNIGPGRDGLLPDADADRLLAFSREIRRRFAEPFATKDDFRQVGGQWEYTSEEARLLDHIVLMEDLRDGERVETYSISVVTAKTGREVKIHEGRTIGHKAIVRIPTVKVRGVIIRIESENGCHEMRRIELFYAEGNSAR